MSSKRVSSCKGVKSDTHRTKFHTRYVVRVRIHEKICMLLTERAKVRQVVPGLRGWFNQNIACGMPDCVAPREPPHLPKGSPTALQHVHNNYYFGIFAKARPGQPRVFLSPLQPHAFGCEARRGAAGYNTHRGPGRAPWRVLWSSEPVPFQGN